MRRAGGREMSGSDTRWVWGFRVPGVQIPEASRKEWDSPYRKMEGRISPLSPVM